MVYLEDYNHIHIADLFRIKLHPASKPGDGIGVIRQICHVADLYKVDTYIEYMSDEPKLGELYSSCGFEEIHREVLAHPDGGTVVNMKRPHR